MAQYGNRMWMGQMPSGLLGGSDVYRGLVEGMANGFRPSLGGPSADLPPYIDPNAQPMPMPSPMPPQGGNVAMQQVQPGRPLTQNDIMNAQPMPMQTPGNKPGMGWGAAAGVPPHMIDKTPGGGAGQPPMGWGAAAGVPPHMIDKTPGGGQTNWKPPMGGGGMRVPPMQGRPNFGNAQPMPMPTPGNRPGMGLGAARPRPMPPGGGQTNWKPPGRGQPFLMPGNPGRGFRG
jgi:hypothetical protein